MHRWLLAAIVAIAGSHVSDISAQPTDAKPQLQRMAKFLASQANFSYRVHSGYDVLQKDGQKIQFLESREITVSRPDHIRGDFVQPDGTSGTMVFNGKELKIYDRTENVLATTATIGSIDEAIETMTSKLGIRVPLAMLISNKLSTTLEQKISSADIVGPAVVHGIKCTQVAARGEQADLQVWIDDGPQPFPRRIVLTYKKETGMPQFWADLSDWKLLAGRDESTFELNVPGDADKMEFRTIPGTSAPGQSNAGARKSQETTP